MSDAPTVRVVVVNYNGGAMTLNCLRSIAATAWPPEALHVLLVDNASDDGVVDDVARELPSVTVVRSAVNLGFAGGVNLALRDLPADVAYVALLNSDVWVPPAWLRPLVATLDGHVEYGAACPKLVLADQYEAVEISGDAGPRSALDRRRVTIRVTGARVGGVDVARRARFGGGFLGPEFEPGSNLVFQWASGRASLLLPWQPGAPRRELEVSAPASRRVSLRTGAATAEVTVGTTPTWITLPAPGGPFDVINNVGSEIQPDGYVRDRGYLERDDGQYTRPEEVSVWCGGAVLLSAAYLRSIGLFDGRLFAYYEDVDLSLRGRERGWRYRTAPASVIRHVHMATSSARAPLALYFNERNRLLVLARHASRRTLVREVLRHVAITASYWRRDVLTPWLERRPRSWTIPRIRARAVLDCCRIWLSREPRGAGDA